jgi:hypothetical protein
VVLNTLKLSADLRISHCSLEVRREKVVGFVLSVSLVV